MLCLCKTAVEDYFIESLNCILHTEIAHNSKEACLEWIKRMNFKSQTREEEITSAINSYFESFCEDEDEPIHALAHAIQIILYTFDYKNNSPSEFCRVLGTRCGLAGPRGNAAKNGIWSIALPSKLLHIACCQMMILMMGWSCVN